MNDIQLAKSLGMLSFGLGGLELLAAKRIASALGVGSPILMQAFGVREIVAGLMILTAPDKALPVWSRVAGDAMDAAVLATGLGAGNRRRSNAVGALLFVLAATALDVAVAASLTRREQTALETGRRTRVRRTAALT